MCSASQLKEADPVAWAKARILAENAYLIFDEDAKFLGLAIRHGDEFVLESPRDAQVVYYHAVPNHEKPFALLRFRASPIRLEKNDYLRVRGE